MVAIRFWCGGDRDAKTSPSGVDLVLSRTVGYRSEWQLAVENVFVQSRRLCQHSSKCYAVPDGPHQLGDAKVSRRDRVVRFPVQPATHQVDVLRQVIEESSNHHRNE